MYDDDVDRNGIPDMIQRDPVIVPEPVEIFGQPPDPGLPGITAPIEATAEPEPEPAAQATADLQHEAKVFGTLSSTVDQTLKAIGEGLDSAARK